MSKYNSIVHSQSHGYSTVEQYGNPKTRACNHQVPTASVRLGVASACTVRVFGGIVGLYSLDDDIVSARPTVRTVSPDIAQCSLEGKTALRNTAVEI